MNFISFNMAQNIAIFYGGMRIDYYFTEGIPLLLMTLVPFSALGCFQSLTNRHADSASNVEGAKTEFGILRTLAVVALMVPTTLSFISHKEVRFIYPILPLLFILAARPLSAFFRPFPFPVTKGRQWLLGWIVSVNVIVAIYLGTFHGRGLIGCESFLRQEHERHNDGMTKYGVTSNMNVTTVAFLMPCHSVPWRSQLIYPGIEAWALTCEPPLGLSTAQKETYRDEADIFYADPVSWIRDEFVSRKRPWPMYLVFFEQLREEMEISVAYGSYEEAWRGFNSLWHDDWRRKGDVVVWAKTKDFGGLGRAIGPAPLGSHKVSKALKKEYGHDEL